MRTMIGARAPVWAVSAMLAFLLAACGTSTSVPNNSQALSSSAAAPSRTDVCPTAVDPMRFASADDLWADNSLLAELGLRPTASPSHQKFLDWISQRLDTIPGLRRRAMDFPINNRWLEKSVLLDAGLASGALSSIRVSSPVPYAKVTPTLGVTAPMIYVPMGTSISSANVKDKIVLRDAALSSVPNAVFFALQWWTYDPDLTLTKTLGDDYERDFLGLDQRITDLNEAGIASAAGLVFMHGFPHAQVLGHYAPDEGLNWLVPALYVGADEAEQLKALAAAGGVARIRLEAEESAAMTQTLIATLPGASSERLVVESHTDGTNAHEDNGPVAMVSMLKYFSSLPQSCLPKTLEFVFTTSHFHQHIFPEVRDGGAEQYARELDRDFDNGSVAMTLVLEHLGTRGYAAVPRADGGPGRELKLTGLPETKSIFINNSPVLVATVAQTVADHDDRGFIALRGADLPGAHIPLHFSLGGEGTPYNKHLIPTVAYITSPWPLFSPAYGMDAIDKEQLHRQTLMFTDMILRLSGISRYLLAGPILAERQARDLACMQGQPSLVAYCKP